MSRRQSRATVVKRRPFPGRPLAGTLPWLGRRRQGEAAAKRTMELLTWAG